MKKYITTAIACCTLLFAGNLYAKPKIVNKTEEQRLLIHAAKKLRLKQSSIVKPTRAIIRNKQAQSRKQLQNNKENIERRRAQLAIKVAKQQLHKRYRWGGASPSKGFDCSGLTQYAYKFANIRLPRTAANQYKKTKRISPKHLKPGDLIFFKTRRNRARINHVGIYLGGQNFIHAPNKRKRVSVSRLDNYWQKKIVGAGRV